MSDNIIELKGVNKWFGDFQVLKNVDLSVGLKQKIVVCGPSGSGKSTLIRCINRLEEHQEGQIKVDGIELTEATKDIEKINALSKSILWMVVPSLALFISLPVLLKSGVNFYISMGISILVTMGCYWLTLATLAKFGIKL